MAIKTHVEISPEDLIRRIDDVAIAVSQGCALYVRRGGKTLFVILDPIDFADLLQAEMFVIETTAESAQAADSTSKSDVVAAIQPEAPAPIAPVPEDTPQMIPPIPPGIEDHRRAMQVDTGRSTVA
jgi:hypothetical protein